MSRERIICVDGFSMSVQASTTHYCSPKADSAESYGAVEVGHPSQLEELLEPHMEGDDGDDPTKAIYPYTPAAVVLQVIAKHGGVADGQLPPLHVTDLEQRAIENARLHALARAEIEEERKESEEE